MKDDLPPMPKNRHKGWTGDLYTADQMHEYARAALAMRGEPVAPFNDVTQLQIAYIKGLGDAAPPSRKPEQEPHPDDRYVDAFAQAMKEKLAQARAKGRGGWQTCPPDELSRMLREHVEKGDPRDVANFCMFLWSLGHGIAKRKPLSDAQAKQVLWREHLRWMEAQGMDTEGMQMGPLINNLLDYFRAVERAHGIGEQA